MMSPQAARLMGGFRLAVCVLAGLGLSFAFDWPRPEWAAIASIVMNLPFLGASVDRAITRLLGTVAGAVLGLACVALFAEHQIMFLAVLFGFVSVCMYMGQGTFYPYSFMLSSVTTLIVALPALNVGASAPQEAWGNALFRTLETSLGITVSLAVNAVLWPAYAGVKLRELLGGALAACGRLLELLLPDQLAARQSPIAHAALARQTAGQLLQSTPLFNFALRDTAAVRRRRAAYATALDDVRSLLAAVGELHLGHAPPPPGAGTRRLTPALSRLGDLVRTELEGLRAAWQEGRATLPEPVDFGSADAAFLADYEKARHLDAHAPELIRLMGARAALKDAWAALQALRLSLAATNGPVRWQRKLPPRPPLPADTRFARRQRWHISLKAGLAVTIGAAAVLFTNAPGGIGLAVSAQFFVVITVLVRFQPSIPLILGMLTGSLLAGAQLYWMFPWVNGNFFGLALVMFPVLMAWGWLAGFPRFTGVALLGCVLYVYSIDPLEHQTYDLMAYASLVVGQILGTSLAALCLVIPWPRYPQAELRRLLAQYWHCAAELTGALAVPLPWTPAQRETIRALQHLLLVLPNEAAAWIGDLPPGHFPAPLRERLLAHLAAAQSLALQLQALEHARVHLPPMEIYDELVPALADLSAACSKQMAALCVAFADGTVTPPVADLLPVCRALVARVEEERAAGRTFKYPPVVIGCLSALLARTQDVVRDLLGAQEVLLPGDSPALAQRYFL